MWLTDDLPAEMQPSESMGDDRHKNSPPDDEEEEVTELFRAAARHALDLNKRQNALRGKRKGDAGYLTSNRAELALKIGTDKTMVNKIIGPARASTKVKLVDRSAFVGRIRRELELPPVVSIQVPSSRVQLLKRIADMPEVGIQAIESAFFSKKEK